MKKIIAGMLVLLCCSAGVVSAARSLVFIGLSGDNAPAFEKNFELMLREQIAVMPDLKPFEDFELKLLRNRLPSLDYPTVSKAIIETISRFAPDTALIVWGRIKSYSIRPVRKNLIQAVAQGNLVLELFVYSIAQQNYLFFGDVLAKVEKSKGMIFFGDAETMVMVTTNDRSDLIEQLELEASAKAGRLILAVVQSEQSVRRNRGLSTISKKRVVITDDPPEQQQEEGDEDNEIAGGDRKSLDDDEFPQKTKNPPEQKKGEEPAASNPLFE